MKAMILAAGKGTRLLPLTEQMPKALVPFHGVPILKMIISQLAEVGFNELVINVYHHKDQIIEYVRSQGNFGLKITFSEESELLDTGGGIKRAANLLGDEPVLFHNIDILSDIDLKALMDFHLDHGAPVTLAVKNRDTSRNLLFNHDGLLAGWEYPEKHMRIISRRSKEGYAETAFSGIYVMNPDFFTLFPDDPVFSIMPWLLEQSKDFPIAGFDHSDDYWFDLGTSDNLNRAARRVKLGDGFLPIFPKHGK